MAVFRRKEDQADKWLRKHDPYYTNTDRSKRSKEDSPYDTPEQERRRRETEIPISNLNKSQRVTLKGIAGAYDDEGNFNL